MDTIKFYEELKEMTCLQGDTLSEFYVTVENMEGAMELILEDMKHPGSIVFTLPCSVKSASDDSEGNTFVTYAARLTTEQTKNLSGLYRWHFVLTDENGLQYKKLTGILKVIPVPQKGESV